MNMKSTNEYPPERNDNHEAAAASPAHDAFRIQGSNIIRTRTSSDSDTDDDDDLNIDMDMDMDINMNMIDMMDQYTNIPPITRPVSIDLGDNDTTDHEHDLDHDPNDNDHNHENVPSDAHDHYHHIPPPPPPRPSEQTAREQLIERERQARLEREKAKLKQQLAMKREWEEEDQKFEEADIARVNSDDSIANTSIRGMELQLDVDVGIDVDADVDVNVGESGQDGVAVGMARNKNDIIENGDVIEDQNGDRDGHGHDHGHDQQELTGTNDEKPASPLGFTMERFLKDGVVVSKKGDAPHDHDDPQEQIMAAAAASAGGGHTGISISENRENAMTIHPEAMGGTRSMINLRDDGTNVSMEAGHDHDHSELSPVVSSRVDITDVGVSPTIDSQRNGLGVGMGVDDEVGAGNDLPRLAQLTEAEILEMTELDYASVGNMPPRSVRDERHLPDISGTSHTSFDQTHTTVQGSDMSGGADSSHNTRSQGGDTTATVESPMSNVARLSKLPVETFALSASNASVVVNQSDASVERSDISDRKPAAIGGHTTCSLNNLDGEEKWSNVDENEDEDMPEGLKWHEHDKKAKRSQSNEEICLESLVVASKDVNSSMESYNLPNRIIRPGMIKVASSGRTSSKGHRRSQTTPNIPSFVDDFDYCKYNDTGASSNRGSQFFVSDFDPQIHTNPGSNLTGLGDGDFFSNYGSADMESQPLLKAKTEDTRGSMVDDMVDSVFSSVRSMSTADFQAEINDCDKYSSSPALSRAISDRCLPLIITIVIEIPVLLMISGGSGRLCALIGRSRYQLLMAFLPLSSAISGNCGLQAGSLATRAISHLHVTKENYLKWLLTEIKVAAILGLGMGLLIGLIAFQASGFDYGFGFVIFVANFVCVLTSGLTGTLAPLVFTFIFHQDAGKWGSLLGTAFQDIVGAFAMVIFSFHVLEMLGPVEVDADDVCGIVP